MIGSLCFVTPIPASLESTRSSLRWDNIRQIMPKQGLTGTEPVPAPTEAQITPDTVVVLNGRTCEYKDIPRSATIAGMTLSTDGRTIVRIDFRTR
ncbi:MAG: hypothetical protein U0791_06035 [Gemmataceae bacterium]